MDFMLKVSFTTVTNCQLWSFQLLKFKTYDDFKNLYVTDGLYTPIFDSGLYKHTLITHLPALVYTQSWALWPEGAVSVCIYTSRPPCSSGGRWSCRCCPPWGPRSPPPLAGGSGPSSGPAGSDPSLTPPPPGSCWSSSSLGPLYWCTAI